MIARASSWLMGGVSATDGKTPKVVVSVVVQNEDGYLLSGEAELIDNREDEITFELFKAIASKMIKKYG